ncbi:YwiC-like family protein [bacterium]|nr:YwiC-like family protein [bacterium]
MRRKIFIPSEHGAWAMVYTPFIITSFVLGEFNLKAVWLLLALTGIFFAHKPLEVLARLNPLSHNADLRRRSAIRWLAIYVIISLLSSAALILLYQLWLLLPIGLAAILYLSVHTFLISKKSDKTVFVEMLGILNLTGSAPALYYVLRGNLDQTALLLWAICLLYFISSIFYVKMLIGRFSKKPNSAELIRKCITYHLILMILLIVSLSLHLIPVLVIVGFLPVIGRTIWGIQVHQIQWNLRKVGLTEIA